MPLTPKNIVASEEIYERIGSWKLLDGILREFRNRPNDKSAILTKVVLLNTFYSTQIWAYADMAQHIVELVNDQNLINLISTGDEKAVNLIASAEIGDGNNDYRLSFGSKYCHFHNTGKYPIYDRYAVEALKHINGRRRNNTVLGFTNGQLSIDTWKKENNQENYYKWYKSVIDKLIKKINGPDIDFTKIDHYLWLFGQAILMKKREERRNPEEVHINKEIKQFFEYHKDKMNALFPDQHH